jgi:cobalamin biosynthesis protein CbiG
MIRYLTEMRANPEAADTHAKVGGWVDAKNHEVVLDWVDVVPTVSQAKVLGRSRGEQYVYQLETGKLFPTGGTGGRENIKAIT